MAGIVTRKPSELFCRAAKRALDRPPRPWLNRPMQIRTKSYSGSDHSDLAEQVRPARRAIPARDIVAALLLTLAAAVLIGAATTTRSEAPEDKRIEAAAGSR